MGFGINGVALATTAALLINFLLLYFFISKRLFSRSETAVIFMKVMYKFILMLAVLLVLDRLINFNSQAAEMLVKLAVFCALSTPFLIALNRKFDLLELFKKK